MKIIIGAIIGIIGLLFGFLGIIFIIGSMGETRRLVVGGTLITVGASLLILGIKLLRIGLAENPEAVKKNLLKLAKLNHGEVPEEVILAEAGPARLVESELQNLVNSGIAKKTSKDNRVYYLFADFNMELIVKQCPFCGNDYPVRDDIEKCTSCGGDLKILKSRIPGKEDKFSMDE